MDSSTRTDVDRIRAGEGKTEGKPVGRRYKLTGRFFSFFITFILLVYVAVVFGTAMMRIAGLKEDIARVEAEIAAIELRNQELQQQIEVLKSDEYIEEAARSQLGLVKPGETRYVVVEPDGTH